jgi:hypothetical protein
MAPVLFSAALTAQGVFSNKTQTILEKVIQDYPNHFCNIKGELISQEQQMAEYRSTLQLPGSPSCMVVLTGGKGVTASTEGYSWTCIVADSESFEAARDKFHEIYGQLSNSIITSSSQKTFILSGVYENPDPEKKYTHVVFSLLPGVGDMRRLKVGLSLHEAGSKWRITLSVNDRDNPDDMQGAVTVN